MEIRRSQDRLISTMGFPTLVRRQLYIESGPWTAEFASHTFKPRCAIIDMIIYHTRWYSLRTGMLMEVTGT